MRANFIFTQSQGYSIEVEFSLHSNEGKWKNEETTLVPSGTVTSQFNSVTPNLLNCFSGYCIFFFLSLKWTLFSKNKWNVFFEIARGIQQRPQ